MYDPAINVVKPARVRVCGLLEEKNRLLLLKHVGLGLKEYIWSPPGGGVEFKESAEEALIREFKEEVNLDIKVVQFLFVNEYRDHRFHAIELFFEVSRLSGDMKLGTDPEMKQDEQILREAKFLSWEEIEHYPAELKHNAFRYCKHPSDIMNLKDFYYFSNI